MYRYAGTLFIFKFLELCGIHKAEVELITVVTQALVACLICPPLSPWALGVYIRLTICAHGITIRYAFGELSLILNTIEINMISLLTSCLCMV